MEYTNGTLLKVLGLTPPVSEGEIKKTYRQLALHYHPDKNPSGKERFIAITDAYQALLSNTEQPAYRTSNEKCYCIQCLYRAYTRALQRVPSDIQVYFAEDIKIIGMVDTSRGERLLVTAAVTRAFWTFWNHEKEYLREHNFSVSKDTFTDEWRLCFWITYE